MGEIVNLRHARKQRARAEKERAAAENRASFGHRKEDRERERLLAEKAERFVEAHRREPTEQS